MAKLSYNSGDQDFTAQLTEIIKPKKPDVLFIPSTSPGASKLEAGQGAEVQFKKIMGGDAMDNLRHREGRRRTAVEGFSLHHHFPTDHREGHEPGGQEVHRQLEKVFPKKDPNVNSALGYDSYMLIMDAIKRAGKAEPEAITKALASTKGFLGVTGATTINATHDAEKPWGSCRSATKRVFLTTVEPKL